MGEYHDYVEAALALGGYSLDQAALERVQLEFSRIAVIAGLLDDKALNEHAEPLPVYRP